MHENRSNTLDMDMAGAIAVTSSARGSRQSWSTFTCLHQSCMQCCDATPST